MNIKTIIETERALSQAVEDYKNSILSDIKTTPGIAKITTISDNPKVFTIKASALESLIFDPSYYNQNEQNNAVAEYLMNAASLKEVYNKINLMVTKKSVPTKYGQCKLNNSSVGVLQKYLAEIESVIHLDMKEN